MSAVTIQDIDEHLRGLPPEKLMLVYNFISDLLESSKIQKMDYDELSARNTMLASEAVLRRDWDTPEEDEAWAHL